MDFPFSFNEKSGLLLIFFFNSLIFTFLLLKKGFEFQHKSSKWLAFLLFLCAMYITPFMLGYASWYSKGITREILFFVPFMQVLLIGPVIYFYIQSLLNNRFVLSKKDWIHLIPAGMYLIYTLVVFITDKIILDEFYFYADGKDKDMATWYQVVGLFSMSFYLVLSLKYYANYKKLILENVSFANSILFSWIPNFLIAFLLIIVLRTVFFITNPEWGEFGSQFWHYIAFSLVVFYITINGYANALKLAFLTDINSENNSIIIKEKPVEKILPNVINDKEVNIWKIKILELIENQKIYKNPKLTLRDLSKLLDTNSKTISYTINSGFKMNFNDFINYYRIEDVKKSLKNNEHKTSTLLGIAFDAGFNSKATFNRSFKKNTGKTPKEYLKNLS